MINILPNREEFKPIIDRNNTFSECIFNKDFSKLSFEEKLQVVNDLVRQSLISDYYFDYTNHKVELKGNCHTAAQVSIKYLKYLNIGQNYRYVLSPCRYFDIDDYYSKHAILLIDDKDGNTYQYDASPFVGYKYGHVVNLNQKKLYKEYINIDINNYFFIKELEKFQLLARSDKINSDNLNYYRNIIFEASKYDYLSGFVSSAFKTLSRYEDNNYDVEKDIILSIKYNKFSKLNKENFEKRKKFLLKQIKIWYDELVQLPDGKRKLELSQNVIQELKYLDLVKDYTINIYGRKISFSHLTPRLLKEYGLTDIMIKPSAFFTHNDQYIKEKMVGSNSLIFGEYVTNLSIPTEICGLKKMIYSHPVGEEYIRSMTGCSQIMLVKKGENELYSIKKSLRSQLGRDMYNKYVIWSDGKPILWHPFVTNYIHSADNPSESCLHYLINYPEHQVMTRYMYPNKKLGGR